MTTLPGLGAGVYPVAMQSNEFLRLLDGQLDYDVWPTAPLESHPSYFRTWQHVSVALQRGLRVWAPEFYFRDLGRCEDRDGAYAMVVYSACRLFYGHPRTEFTYDIADEATLHAAVRTIGCGIERTLAFLEARLKAGGCAELARSYSPLWYQDVLAAVKKRPRRLITLLAREAKLIDAVIDLGTQRNRAAARKFVRRSNSALRNLGGVDMRSLLPRVLHEVTMVLAQERREGARHDDDRAILSRPKWAGPPPLRVEPAGKEAPSLRMGLEGAPQVVHGRADRDVAVRTSSIEGFSRMMT
jgi:hypothetical protein